MAANPVHLLYVLEQALEREQLPSEVFERYLGFIKEYMAPRYVDFIGKEIQTAYLESYSEYGQNILTVMSPMQTFGFRIRSIVTTRPVSC
ncbi:hypothetical protein HSBAA_44050 [Vreelandella sulfidaeris]|uniref:PrkA C-terminal domain-containing protein n=1 Tax=Vreelandella sulfidaeris TaxID=115553 RepID=A0A455UFQ6_9GAMM|nr:hypothetical protein HSBAA_44050 [Halomonas sulfidaeris]